MAAEAAPSPSSTPAASSSFPQIKHDVFVSFRGEDTRYNFVSHLVGAFGRKQINTFIDYRLKKGDSVPRSLLDAIEASRISVIIFSKEYASSSWCLDELVKIIECMSKYGQIVIPIFYYVDPSEVRNQTGIFGVEFMKLERRCQERLEFEKLQPWRSALQEAANVAGSHYRDRRLVGLREGGPVEKTRLQCRKEMGRELVRQESTDYPGKRSRLSHPEDVYKVLTQNMGTEAIKGILFDMSKVKEIHLDPNVFTKMPNLRFLKFYGENKCKVSHFEDQNFSEVRYLHWDGYPLTSLPSSIHPEKLVSLTMHCSNIKQLWDGIQNLVWLTEIDLSGSEHLTKLPDLSLASNLERLILRGCTSLVETHSSIQHLEKLVKLDQTDCKKLEILPTSFVLESLEELYLSGCSNLKRFPEISSSNLYQLYLNGTAIQELPNSLCNLKSLRSLHLDGCSNLRRLPDDLGNLEALKELYAEGTAIREVPSSIVNLSNLVELSFKGCRRHQQIRLLLPNLIPLGGLHSLMVLNLSDCGITGLPENLGQLSSLTYLYLEKNNFESIPASIVELSHLRELNIGYCKRLQSLPVLPCNINHIYAHCCTSLAALSGLSVLFSAPMLCQEQEFELSNCYRLEQDELNQIVEAAKQRIQVLARVWWKERHQAHYTRLGGHIFLPGSEIPGCFSHWSMGSSVNLEMPRVGLRDNFVGFAFCMVVAFGDHHHNEQRFHVSYEYKLKTRNGNWRASNYDSLLDRRIGIRYVGSDHVLLGYFFSEHLSMQFSYIEEAFFYFYLNDENRERMDCCKVIKCGIDLVFTRDFSRSIKDYGL